MYNVQFTIRVRPTGHAQTPQMSWSKGFNPYIQRVGHYG